MAGIGSIKFPYARESLRAIDAWTKTMAQINEGDDIDDLLSFADAVDDFVEFQTASDEELAEIAGKIGMEAFIELRREMRQTGQALGMLGM